MLSRQQKEYLDAMGISVWSLREPPSAVTGKVNETRLEEPVGRPSGASPGAPVPAPAEAVPEPAPGTGHNVPGLKLGPGRGGILLVCEKDSDSASRLANDISRALGSVPVWAWPDTGAGAARLDDAVQENLFTTVAIFGDELARRFFAADVPSSVHAANLVRLPAMQDIGTQAEARLTLWAALCRSGMVSRA